MGSIRTLGTPADAIREVSWGRKLRKMKKDAIEETACFCKLSDPQAMSLHNPYECFRDPANRSLRVGACNPAIIPSSEF
jgi:hypothetical protein